MTTALQAAEFRVPGALVRAMADFLLKIRPGLSRMALARRLRDRLDSRGVHYSERTIRRQLNGVVSSVPRPVEREMRSLLFEIGDFDEDRDIEQALTTAGLRVPPEKRRSRYVKPERVVTLVRLWLHLHPERSKRFLARTLSADLQNRGLGLTLDTLQPILAGKRRSARREVLEQLLEYLVPFDVTSEDSARSVLSRLESRNDSRFAGREPVAAAEFHELAKVWQWRNRGASKRKLAGRLEQELKNRGVRVDYRRLQSLLSGAGESGHRREYDALKTVVRECFRDNRRYDIALKRVKPGSAVATDLEWVKSKPIADLAKSWLADHPGSSKRQLALLIKRKAKRLGYDVGLSAIQSLLADRTKRARGFIYRAMLALCENKKRAKIPPEHILYPKRRAALRKTTDKQRRSSENRIDDSAQYHGADVLDIYLHEIGTVPRLSRKREYEIAKRIEQAEAENIAATVASGIGKRAVRKLIDRLGNGKQSARDLVRSFDNDPAYDEKRYQHLLRAIDSVSEHVEENCNAVQPFSSSNPSAQSDDPLWYVGEQHEYILGRNLAKIKLSKRAIEKIVNRIDRLIRLAAKAERKKQGAQRQLRLIEKNLSRPESPDSAASLAWPNRLGNSEFKAEELDTIRNHITATEQRLRRIEMVAGVSIDRLRELRKIQNRAERDWVRAMQELVEANLPLVVWVARKYRQNGMALSDIIQEGNIGLIKALNRFDRRRGIRFSSYAFWWIRACIMRAIDDQSRTIRISVPALDKIRSLRRVGYLYSNRLGRNATLEEIADETDMPIEKVRALLETPNRTLSLDVPIYEEGNAVFGDRIPDGNVASPSDAAAFNELRERMIGALSELTPRERTVVQMRYGLNESSDYTLQEIGDALHLSRERIRQIELDALEKLRRLLNIRTGNIYGISRARVGKTVALPKARSTTR